MSEGERYLTVAEVAARLKVNHDTVRRWLKTGRLHGILPGGTKAGYRIPASALAQFIADAEHKNRSSS